MLDRDKLPRHVAIIMDGNGRWATRRGLPRIQGHIEGAKRVEEIVIATRDLGIPYLTLFVFSTENWNRPKEEVEFLFSLLENYMRAKKDTFVKENIRLVPIGRIDEIPKGARDALLDVVEATRSCNGVTVVCAINYGGRGEILDCVKRIAQDVRRGVIDPDSLSEDILRNYLYFPELPDCDLLIRTSGEIRISNFILWHMAYSELFFTDVLWPDFTKDEYIRILEEYTKRDRRFGGLNY